MLMCYGLFVFSINTLTYQTLDRSTQWRHATNNRVGARPASQFVGQGDDKITLAGWIASDLPGEAVSLDIIRAMGDTGQPSVMVGGTGRVFGLWVIEELGENHSLFYPNGKARRIEFTLTLRRVDDDQIDQVTLITNALDVLQ